MVGHVERMDIEIPVDNCKFIGVDSQRERETDHVKHGPKLSKTIY